MIVAKYVRGVSYILAINCDTLFISACPCRIIVASEDLRNASSDSRKRIALTPRAPVAAGIDNSGNQGRLQLFNSAEQPCEGTSAIKCTAGPLRISGRLACRDALSSSCHVPARMCRSCVCGCSCLERMRLPLHGSAHRREVHAFEQEHPKHAVLPDVDSTHDSPSKKCMLCTDAERAAYQEWGHLSRRQHQQQLHC